MWMAKGHWTPRPLQILDRRVAMQTDLTMRNNHRGGHHGYLSKQQLKAAQIPTRAPPRAGHLEFLHPPASTPQHTAPCARINPSKFQTVRMCSTPPIHLQVENILTSPPGLRTPEKPSKLLAPTLPTSGNARAVMTSSGSRRGRNRPATCRATPAASTSFAPSARVSSASATSAGFTPGIRTACAAFQAARRSWARNSSAFRLGISARTQHGTVGSVNMGVDRCFHRHRFRVLFAAGWFELGGLGGRVG